MASMPIDEQRHLKTAGKIFSLFLVLTWISFNSFAADEVDKSPALIQFEHHGWKLLSRTESPCQLKIVDWFTTNSDDIFWYTDDSGLVTAEKGTMINWGLFREDKKDRARPRSCFLALTSEKNRIEIVDEKPSQELEFYWVKVERTLGFYYLVNYCSDEDHEQNTRDYCQQKNIVLRAHYMDLEKPEDLSKHIDELSDDFQQFRLSHCPTLVIFYFDDNKDEEGTTIRASLLSLAESILNPPGCAYTITIKIPKLASSHQLNLKDYERIEDRIINSDG